MRLLWTRLRRWGAAIVVVCMAAACNVHEWPELDYRNARFLLHLDFSEEMPLYKVVTYTRAEGDTRVDNASRVELPPHDMRYIINVYRTGVAGVESRTPEYTFVFTRNASAGWDYTAELELDEGTYTFLVWADYVDAGSKGDKYYRTSDFSDISLIDKDNHPGSNDYRDAFRGTVTATVEHPDRYMGEAYAPVNEATVPMERPMGRYEFISTDVEQFLTRVASMRSEGDAQQQSEASSEQTRAVDLNDYYVVFNYNAFMPCTFNNFTNKPGDSWTGVNYTSRMELTEEGMSLGFDYIFVNGAETQMNVRVDVYNKQNVLLSSTPSVMVPVVRSKLTLVKGEFLTSRGAGGVTVNPDFDGPDFNIEIH